jgi:hypothetical protein
MNNSILLQNVSPEELTKLISDGIKGQLDDLKKLIDVRDPNELLSRDEACKYLQIDSSTLWHWTNKKKVIAYGIGNRRYYKKAELVESLIPVKK